MNRSPLVAFMANTQKATLILENIQAAVDDHYDVLPEAVNWADVGSAEHTVNGLLGVLAAIQGVDPEEVQLEELQ